MIKQITDSSFDPSIYYTCVELTGQFAFCISRELRLHVVNSEEVQMWNGRDLITFTAADPGLYTLPSDNSKVITLSSGRKYCC